jgi:serine protease Do
MRRTLALLVASIASGTGLALPPDQVFERAGALTWQVRALAADEKLLTAASGIAIAPGKVVTSCSVLARARQLQLRRGNTIYDAKLEAPDVERDLCQLEAPGLASPAPALGSARELRPGKKLYVIGFGLGNALTLGEGLVSAVHDAGTANERIQTTIPAASGLLGAGVYDEEARLVGVVTSSPKQAAASLFALPADWVPEIAARGAAALAARSKPAAAAAAGGGAPGLPAAGTTWVYAFAERVFTRRQVEFTVQVLGTAGDVVQESLSAPGAQASRLVVDPREPLILERRLDGPTVLMEAPPYLLVAGGGRPPANLEGVSGYPKGESILPRWINRASVEDWEQVNVPAGTYRALRIVMRGERAPTAVTGGMQLTGRFELVAWYAPEVKRYVRLEHKAWSGSFGTKGQQTNHDVVELLRYQPGK